MDMRTARGERMLRRVIALLAAFAVLAERVAGRSLAVRLFLLWILRRAETAAADFVFEETGIPPSAIAGIAVGGNDPAEALRLAARFRALAAALLALLPIACPFRRRPATRGFARGQLTPGSGRGPSCWTRKPYDTS